MFTKEDAYRKEMSCHGLRDRLRKNNGSSIIIYIGRKKKAEKSFII